MSKAAYGPYGEGVPPSSSSFGYSGQRYDSETGLYYYKARYYSPSLGRFLQPDPSRYGYGDLNLYQYVLGDPLNENDPYGEFTALEGAIAVIIIATILIAILLLCRGCSLGPKRFEMEPHQPLAAPSPTKNARGQTYLPPDDTQPHAATPIIDK